MTKEETAAWLEAFKAEHGYYPNEDPDLLGKGMSDRDAMQEHLKAKSWSEEWSKGTGRAPTKDEYRSEQPRRYSDSGELVSGFGGFTPEKIESLERNRPTRGGDDGMAPTMNSKPMMKLQMMRPPRRNTVYGGRK